VCGSLVSVSALLWGFNLMKNAVRLMSGAATQRRMLTWAVVHEFILFSAILLHCLWGLHDNSPATAWQWKELISFTWKWQIPKKIDDINSQADVSTKQLPIIHLIYEVSDCLSWCSYFPWISNKYKSTGIILHSSSQFTIRGQCCLMQQIKLNWGQSRVQYSVSIPLSSG
jgi:hypothetical protein